MRYIPLIFSQFWWSGLAKTSSDTSFLRVFSLCSLLQILARSLLCFFAGSLASGLSSTADTGVRVLGIFLAYDLLLYIVS